MERTSQIETADTQNGVDTLTKTMKIRHFLGDAMGSVSLNIITNLVGMIVFFYTDIIGLAVEVVGMIMLAAKLFDVFTDVGMGVIIDRAKSRYGIARPWLLRMAAPAFFAIVLMFAIPAGASMNVKLAYILTTNILLIAVVQTAISIPYGGLMSLETSIPYERSKMGVWRTVFAYAASALVNILLIPATNFLGGDQRSWIIMGVFLGAVSMGTLVIAFYSIKERNVVSSDAEPKIPLVKGISLLLKNKYWIMLLAANVLINLIYALANGTSVYYAKYIFGNESLVAMLGFSDLLFAFISFIMVGSVIKKAGNRGTVLFGMAIAVLGCVLRAANPYAVLYGVITKGITTMGTVSVLIASNAMMADVIEYGEWKTGKRMVGLPSSVSSFGAKLASSIWVGAVGWLLAWSGYSGLLSEQPPMANMMIMILNIHIPLICYVLIFILMVFYKLDKDYSGIVAELVKRRNASGERVSKGTK